jgi:hypothetical protein
MRAAPIKQRERELFYDQTTFGRPSVEIDFRNWKDGLPGGFSASVDVPIWVSGSELDFFIFICRRI